ncbi:hypothetical protein NADFUDRAFT_43083 [Nadsonia fulvescens var. elongata DSM 6958]|uniref:ARM repeat-containing protein n=1 Tax=Nadsonia fulvescens var. elongata DSM 6958 TaxID=857566 RepID=A0A1E3PIW0_9ASCO|nr:hypothetical protein NADFUDRAFT_43083 [Nadsonia fulvescens var. elongata DSM 6958]
MVSDSFEEEQLTLGSLDFDQDLLAIRRNVSDLLKALKTLHEELKTLQQEEVDLTSLTDVKDQIIHPQIIDHKNAGVRAYVACCLCDMLRLYAPDAPYTLKQLRTIFGLFKKQILSLKDREQTYYNEAYYLLESLVQVRCIVLATDFPDAEKFVTGMFEDFYTLNKTQGTHNVELLLTSILSQLVEESDIIPPKVIKIILSHLLTPNTVSNIINKGDTPMITQSFKNPGFNLSKAICTENMDIMTRQVNHYFSEEFNDVSKEEDQARLLENLKKLHRLAIAIWKAVPEIITNVIGHIEQELLTDDISARLLATETIGEMLSYFPSRVNFISEHKTVYSSWLTRINDKASQVRNAWTESVPFIIKNRNDVSKEVTDALLERLNDIDERVRVTACKAFGQLDLQTLLSKFRGKKLETNLSNRLRDVKTLVHVQAFETVGTIYNMAYESLVSGNTEAEELANWIPSQVLKQIFLADPEINSLIDEVITEKILPFDSDDSTRTRRLLSMINSLDENARKAFYGLPVRQIKLAQYFGVLIQLAKRYNGGTLKDFEIPKEQLEKNISSIIEYLSAVFPDKVNAKSQFESFLKNNNSRSYDLILTCLNSESSYKSVRRAIDELRSPKKEYLLKNDKSLLLPLLYRSSFIFFNESNVLPTLNICKDPQMPLFKTAHEYLHKISISHPAIMKRHINGLTSLVVEIEESRLGKSGDFLKAIASLTSKFPNTIMMDDNEEFFRALKSIALNGSYAEAEQAIKIIKFLYSGNLDNKDYSKLVIEIVDGCFKDLFLIKNTPVFVTRLASLAKLCRHLPKFVESYSSELTPFLIKEVLLKNDTISTEDEPEWIDENEIDETTGEPLLENEILAKSFALKILVNRLIVLTKDENAMVLATPVFKLLISLINNTGEIVPMKLGSTPEYYKNRLLLTAGLLLLKLGKYPMYDRVIRPSDVNRLIHLAQNPCLQVRKIFLEKLIFYLTSEKISFRFFPLLFLVAFEPDTELRRYITTWLHACFQKQQRPTSATLSSIESYKRMELELLLPRLIHMLAHHPDLFDITDVNEIRDAKVSANCIIYYLSIIATEANISYLYYLSQRVKQYSDVLAAPHITIEDATEAERNIDRYNETGSEGDDEREVDTDRAFMKAKTPHEEVDEAKNPENSPSRILYLLSDLSSLLIRQFHEIKSWPLSTWPGKRSLSPDIFSPMISGVVARQIAKTVYLPEEFNSGHITEPMIRAALSKRNFKANIKAKKTGTERDLALGNASLREPSSTNFSKKRTGPKLSSKKPKEKKSKLSTLQESSEVRRSGRLRDRIVNYSLVLDEEEDENEEQESEEESNSDSEA